MMSRQFRTNLTDASREQAPQSTRNPGNMKRMAAQITTAPVCATGDKTSTWLPLGGLVEQALQTERSVCGVACIPWPSYLKRKPHYLSRIALSSTLGMTHPKLRIECNP